MLIRSRLARAFCACAAVSSLAIPVAAQTIDDGIMVGRREFLTGNVYSHDSWDQYWEGALKRRNDNVGTITTKTNVWYANYGVSRRLNVIGAVPYVWTNASQGVLHGIQGFQDVTVAAKYAVLEGGSGAAGRLRAFAVAVAGVPMTDYNPELPPLSIGSGSRRLSGRGTVNYETGPGWFVNGSAAYTWRSHVRLDRPYFYTNDEFVLSDEVDMPNVFDYIASAGLMRPRLQVSGFFAQQRTLGGGDIRRQDMPFVSNRMNVSRAGGRAMVPVPGLAGLEVDLSVAYAFRGRNVGQATTITTGLFYRFNRGAR